MKKVYVLFVCAGLALANNLQAQVGINTTTPDSSAVLHIVHDSKGVLLPTVAADMRATIVSNNVEVGNGLLVYDTEQKLFYFRDSEHKQWLALNPWRVSDATAASPWKDVRLAEEYNGRNVYIGNNTAASAEAKLHVAGTLRTDDMITATSGMRVPSNGVITVFELYRSSNDVYLTDSTKISGTKVKSREFEGYGTTPLGGIIMWSGDSFNIPDGWALCDGKTSNGYKTPDLQGRFIVGHIGHEADESNMSSEVLDGTYYTPGDLSIKGGNPGNTGGERKHKLTVNEMPKHYHGLNINYGLSRHNDDGNKYTPAQDIKNDIEAHWTGTTNEEGGSQAHENRPPFYVLAFIMRVK